MSRILKSGKLRFALLVVLLAAISAVTGWWWLMLLMSIPVANKLVIHKAKAPMKLLGNNRKIEKIETLVIGDMCSLKVLKRYCNPERSMRIQAPGRSLESSSLILQHLVSRLEPNGSVIIIDRGKNADTSFYDVQYFSLITRLEHGIIDLGRRARYPILYAPLQCFAFLFGLPNHRVTKGLCKNNDIVGLCQRKGLQLSYLYME